MEKTIYLVRHGEVQARPNVFLGTTDVDLNRQGEQQSSFLAEYFADKPIDRCFCTPLQRGQKTATIINQSKTLKIEIEPGLREIDFGLWETRTFSEIEADTPQLTQKWCANPLEFSFPEGDSVADFLLRLETYLEQLKNIDAEYILLITHGGVIRFLLTLLLQLDPQQQFLFEIGRGSLTTIKLYDNAAILTGLNYGSK